MYNLPTAFVTGMVMHGGPILVGLCSECPYKQTRQSSGMADGWMGGMKAQLSICDILDSFIMYPTEGV